MLSICKRMRRTTRAYMRQNIIVDLSNLGTLAKSLTHTKWDTSCVKSLSVIGYFNAAPPKWWDQLAVVIRQCPALDYLEICLGGEVRVSGIARFAGSTRGLPARLMTTTWQSEVRLIDWKQNLADEAT